MGGETRYARGEVSLMIRCVLLLFASVALLASQSAARASAQSDSLVYLNAILGGAESESDKSAGRLSGGRILLTDDPASYAIYDSLAGQARSLRAEIRNGADMASYYDLEDAVLGGVVGLLQRIRELLVEGANGILGADDRSVIEVEIGQLYDQMGETLQDAEFNQKRLFFPSGLATSLFDAARYRELGSVDLLLTRLLGERTAIGALRSALGFTIAGQGTEGLNTESASSQGDTDIGTEVTNLQRRQILLNADILMLKRELH